jgi:iron complex outermembrane receptor protein
MATNLEDSALLSLDQLINLDVTSVNKKEERAFDSAAAVSVLNGDEILRSGATSIPEALRAIPGMDVAQLNSGEWAISSRGFNGQFADDMLVLEDGRSLYNPLFSGVFWDLQQSMLEDLDRIEVIRGPGATVWGANAVNGVINIETKSARDTQGALVYASGGDPVLTSDGGRYGGKLGDETYYRIFATGQDNNEFPLQATGTAASNSFQGTQGGFRVDHYGDEDRTHLTWQGDISTSALDDGNTTGSDVNSVARLDREFSDRSSLEVQAYYDRLYHNLSDVCAETFDTLDLTAQHTFGWGERNDVIWGLGYRVVFSQTESANPFIVDEGSVPNLQLFSAFVQDEFKLVPDRLTFTVGSKIEHNDITGFEAEPDVRVVFKPVVHQTLWASVSRAVRTPDLLEGTHAFALGFTPPPTNGFFPAVVGNPGVKSEVLWAYEAGYRIQPSPRVEVDLSTFYNDYTRLINAVPDTVVLPGPPGAPYTIMGIPYENNGGARTYGGELSTTWSPADDLRLVASYSLLKEDIDAPAVFGVFPQTHKLDPEQQATLRASYDLTRNWLADAQVRFVDQYVGVPSYVTADLRVAWRPTDRLEIAVVGQNLFQPQHLEGVAIFSPNAEVPRGVYGKLTWKF